MLRIIKPGTFSQAGAETPSGASENGAVTTFVAFGQTGNVLNIVKHCSTLLNMSRHVGVRIPDDLYNIVEQAAKEQGRTISALIVRTMRNVHDPRWNGELGVVRVLAEMPDVVVPASVTVTKQPTEPPTETYTPRKRESSMCVHGRETKFCVYCQRAAKGK